MNKVYTIAVRVQLCGSKVHERNINALEANITEDPVCIDLQFE